MSATGAYGNSFLRSIILLCCAATAIQGFGGSCSFRCQMKPTLLDYMRPFGCYCHSTCGGKLRCCSDKKQLCDKDHACSAPPTVSGATHSGGRKYFYAKYETITYECKFHYEIEGPSRRTCMGNNIWTRPPKCRYITFVCRPPSISNGNYVIKKKQYVNGDTVTVTCNPGYVMQGTPKMWCLTLTWKDRPSCILDRCSRYPNSCSKDATCTNYSYSTKCTCKEGFTGSGSICKPIPCYRHSCGKNEVCVDDGGVDKCECETPYLRIGGGCVEDPCSKKICHENASCERLDSGDAVCRCNEGFEGNGTECEKITCTDECHTNATCEEGDGGLFSCVCDEHFVGDGTYCEEEESSGEMDDEIPYPAA